MRRDSKCIEVIVTFKKICVVGLGYIGLPTASTFAAHGVQVVGVDINPGILTTLRGGGLHIVEPGLKTLFQKAISSGNLTFQDTPEEADAFLISVPTPFKDGKLADMRFVISATESLVPFIRKGCLVILESTSPPQTTIKLLQPILERSGLKCGEDFYLAYSPERVLPGQILRELIENARVIGGVNTKSAEMGRDLYSIFVKGEIVLTDATTAEMVKLMENTYRDVNIAIANEFALLSDRMGIDVWEAISIANRHPLVKVLNPGPGVGGHCISVDPWFLVEAAPDITPLIKTARIVNDTQPKRVVDWMQRKIGSLIGKKIASLGLSYKPDVDDFRESPAVEVAHLLKAEGAEVIAYDPYACGDTFHEISLVDELDAIINKADAVLLLVAHEKFKALKPEYFSGWLQKPVLFDVVNVWNSPEWRSSPLRIFRLGDNKTG